MRRRRTGGIPPEYRSAGAKPPEPLDPGSLAILPEWPPPASLPEFAGLVEAEESGDMAIEVDSVDITTLSF